jgi:16S rRNA C967 or C1407 C5-methylase (RsmB/RsmF family)
MPGAVSPADATSRKKHIYVIAIYKKKNNNTRKCYVSHKGMEEAFELMLNGKWKNILPDAPCSHDGTPVENPNEYKKYTHEIVSMKALGKFILTHSARRVLRTRHS